MQTYLVGGAVRDTLLNLQVHERDWVVVGASPEQMLRDGYQQVGRDFPVFLHPQSKEEYALARTERKNGMGYTGFNCYAAADVTLEQDLLRRDLTINAIAMDQDNQLIDPYHGIDDINNRILRHVSPAFIEDPLRVLRVARFASRFRHLGFTIAPETMRLMKDIVASGELLTLSAERIWKELSRSLQQQQPWVFFEVLHECGALASLMPEIEQFASLPENQLGSLAGGSDTLDMALLKATCELTQDLSLRYASLVYPLAPAAQVDHEQANSDSTGTSVMPCQSLSSRLRVPKDIATQTEALCASSIDLSHLAHYSAAQLLAHLEKLDIWRRPERAHAFLLICQATMRVTYRDQAREQQALTYLKNLLEAAESVDVKEIVAAGFQGIAIRNEVARRRVNAIAALPPYKQD